MKWITSLAASSLLALLVGVVLAQDYGSGVPMIYQQPPVVGGGPTFWEDTFIRANDNDPSLNCASPDTTTGNCAWVEGSVNDLFKIFSNQLGKASGTGSAYFNVALGTQVGCKFLVSDIDSSSSVMVIFRNDGEDPDGSGNWYVLCGCHSSGDWRCEVNDGTTFDSSYDNDTAHTCANTDWVGVRINAGAGTGIIVDFMDNGTTEPADDPASWTTDHTVNFNTCTGSGTTCGSAPGDSGDTDDGDYAGQRWFDGSNQIEIDNLRCQTWE